MRRFMHVMGLCLLALTLLLPATAWGAMITGALTPDDNSFILGTDIYVVTPNSGVTFTGPDDTALDDLGGASPYTYTWTGTAGVTSTTNSSGLITGLMGNETIELEVNDNSSGGWGPWKAGQYNIVLMSNTLVATGDNLHPTTYLSKANAGIEVKLTADASAVGLDLTALIAANPGLLTFTWLKNGVPINPSDVGYAEVTSGTKSTLTLTGTGNVLVNGDTGPYSCRIAFGADAFHATTDNMYVAWEVTAGSPVFSVSSVTPGANFTVSLPTGDPKGAASNSYAYQWFRNGTLIPGATGPTCVFTVPDDVTASDYYGDEYSCKVWDALDANNFVVTGGSLPLKVDIKVTRTSAASLQVLASDPVGTLEVLAIGGTGTYDDTDPQAGWFYSTDGSTWTSVASLLPTAPGTATLDLSTLAAILGTPGTYLFKYAVRDDETTPAANYGESDVFTVESRADLAVNLSHNVSTSGTGVLDGTTEDTALVIPQNWTGTASPLTGSAHVALICTPAGGIGTLSYTWFYQTGPGWGTSTSVPGSTNKIDLTNLSVGTYRYACQVEDSGMPAHAATNYLYVTVVPPLTTPGLTSTSHAVDNGVIVAADAELMVFEASGWGGTGSERIEFLANGGALIASDTGSNGKASTPVTAHFSNYDVWVTAQVVPVNQTFTALDASNQIRIKVQLAAGPLTHPAYVYWPDVVALNDNDSVSTTLFKADLVGGRGIVGSGGNTVRNDTLKLLVSTSSDMTGDVVTYTYGPTSSSSLPLLKKNLTKYFSDIGFDIDRYFVDNNDAPLSLYMRITVTGEGDSDSLNYKGNDITPNMTVLPDVTFTIYSGVSAIANAWSEKRWSREIAFIQAFGKGGAAPYTYSWLLTDDGGTIWWDPTIATPLWDVIAVPTFPPSGLEMVTARDLPAGTYEFMCDVTDSNSITSAAWTLPVAVEIVQVPDLEITVAANDPNAINATGVSTGTRVILTADPIPGKEGTNNLHADNSQGAYWSWQWYKDGVPMAGETGRTYDLGSVPLNLNGATFTCEWTEKTPGDDADLFKFAERTASETVTLKVNARPSGGGDPSDPVVPVPAVKDFQIVNPGNLTEGKSALLKVDFTPVGSTGKIIWESLTPEIVSITEGGIVTGLKPGSAEIQGTLDGTNMVRTCMFTVVAPDDNPTTQYAVSIPNLTFKPGDSIDVRFDSSPSGAKFTYTGSLPGNLKLSEDGRLTGTIPAAGAYTIESITVTWPDGHTETRTGVRITVNEDGTVDPGKKNGGGGGCNAGLGLFALLLGAACLLKRER